MSVNRQGFWNLTGGLIELFESYCIIKRIVIHSDAATKCNEFMHSRSGYRFVMTNPIRRKNANPTWFFQRLKPSTWLPLGTVVEQVLLLNKLKRCVSYKTHVERRNIFSRPNQQNKQSDQFHELFINIYTSPTFRQNWSVAQNSTQMKWQNDLLACKEVDIRCT